MKLWHAANIYWLLLTTFICYAIYDHSFETDALGPNVTWVLIGFVVLSAALMIGEFQYAWYVWLNGFDKHTIEHYKKKHKI